MHILDFFVAPVFLFTTITTTIFNSRCTFFSAAWKWTLQFEKNGPLCQRLLFVFNHWSNMAEEVRTKNGVHRETFTIERTAQK
ncbi:hypothetical protein Y032_0323g2504 [Ancylostoma ceylanicum]|uniref:Uncharacterized protein n=1 Tax=Ancylostoma ceylanicum TaxID=53326 RepID=A0A016S1B1_9BILA|nr:hypothetical protein Y032_0323g2504 [Ancylostoma ceylanicum]